MWVWRRMLRISWTERKTNTWIQEKMGIPEEQGILQQIKHQNLSKYCHWERRSDSVVLATIKGEIEGKCFPGRRTAWIDDVRRWTGDDMNVARTNAMERRYDCWYSRMSTLRVVRPTAYEQQQQWPLMGGLLHLVQRGGDWAGGATARPGPSSLYQM